MSNVAVKQIKLIGSSFCIVSESFKLEGQSPYVKAFKKGDTQVEILIRK